MKYLIVVSLLMITGCAQLRTGEIRDVECRVLGIDASIPIPFAQSVNIMNIRLGYISTSYVHTYKVDSQRASEWEINYLGKAKRSFKFKVKH